MASLRPWVLYAGRRWRTTGLLVVALLGTAVYGVVADRGHDPVWGADGADVLGVELAHDAAVVYALRRGDAEGRFALEAYDPDGEALWNRTIEAADVHLGTGRGWLAVAVEAEPSRLTLYRAADGVALFEAPLGGVPRGLAADGETVAIALHSPENTVLVFSRMAFERALRLPTFVTALDVSGDTVAAGTADGDVVVDRGGEELARFDAAISVRSVRLDADGSRMAVGGFGPEPGDLSGGVAVYDLDALERRAVPLWSSDTVSGVGMVDVSADGGVVLALEETPVRSALRITAGEGGPALRYIAPGIVTRLGTTGDAGARLAPDGTAMAVVTLTGDVQWVEVPSGRLLWSWRARGGTAVDFAAEVPDAFAASVRLYPSEGYDRLLVFDADDEPFLRDMQRLVPSLVLTLVATGALVLGVGRVRELRG